MSTAQATAYVRRMVELESRGHGDLERALHDLARASGIGFWTLEHLRKGKAKTVEAGLMARLMGAYVRYCEQQVARLLHEIEIEKALTEDASLEDLATQVRLLAEQVQAKKVKASAARGGRAR